MAWTFKLFWDTISLSFVSSHNMLTMTFLFPLQWLLTSSTSKCWYPRELNPQISSLLYSHSLSGDFLQTNGFGYHLDSDKFLIYVSSQDSPLTSRLMFSICLFNFSILMFTRHLKLGICNTKVLFLQNLLCKIFLLSEMAMPSCSCIAKMLESFITHFGM